MICIVWGRGVLEGIFPTRDDALKYMAHLITSLKKKCSIHVWGNTIMISTLSEGSRTYHIKEWNLDTQQGTDITTEVLDDLKKYMDLNGIEYLY